MEAIMNLWEEEVDQPLPESEYASKAKEFVQECRSMLAFISDGYSRCDWMRKEEWSLRGCVLQYLGYRLWHLLVGARELFDLRQRLLCDEHCADFQALVELVDNRCLVLISRLIWDAEEVWKAAGGMFGHGWCQGGTDPGFAGDEALDECRASEWGGAEVAFGEMHGVEVAL